MVVVLVLVGLTFGIVAAALALWLGASFLIALFTYAVAGAVGTVLLALIASFAGERDAPDGEWRDVPKKTKGVLSA